MTDDTQSYVKWIPV